MEITVFYAWQSDRDKKANRYFIQEAAEKVLKRITDDASIDFSLKLDHDTKDVPGMPEITNTILKKIEQSHIFLADLTYVAIGEAEQPGGKSKYVPNPNVLFELGYAFKSLGSERIICVMNTAYGDADLQIFDLAHRRWPIRYELRPEDSEKKVNVRKSLIEDIQSAVRGILCGVLTKAVEKELADCIIDILAFIEAYKNGCSAWAHSTHRGLASTAWRKLQELAASERTRPDLTLDISELLTRLEKWVGTDIGHDYPDDNLLEEIRTRTEAIKSNCFGQRPIIPLAEIKNRLMRVQRGYVICLAEFQTLRFRSYPSPSNDQLVAMTRLRDTSVEIYRLSSCDPDSVRPGLREKLLRIGWPLEQLLFQVESQGKIPYEDDLKFEEQMRKAFSEFSAVVKTLP